MTDQKLKSALAKMLPDKINYCDGFNYPGQVVGFAIAITIGGCWYGKIAESNRCHCAAKAEKSK